MAEDADDLIRSRAYEIWEAEGSPHGRDADHWTQASRELAEARAEARIEPSAPAEATAEPAASVPARRGRKPAAAAAAPASKGRRKKDG